MIVPVRYLPGIGLGELEEASQQGPHYDQDQLQQPLLNEEEQKEEIIQQQGQNQQQPPNRNQPGHHQQNNNDQQNQELNQLDLIAHQQRGQNNGTFNFQTPAPILQMRRALQNNQLNINRAGFGQNLAIRPQINNRDQLQLRNNVTINRYSQATSTDLQQEPEDKQRGKTDERLDSMLTPRTP